MLLPMAARVQYCVFLHFVLTNRRFSVILGDTDRELGEDTDTRSTSVAVYEATKHSSRGGGCYDTGRNNAICYMSDKGRRPIKQ